MCFYNRLRVKMCLKIQFIIGSLLRCLVRVKHRQNKQKRKRSGTRTEVKMNEKSIQYPKKNFHKGYRTRPRVQNCKKVWLIGIKM